MKPEFSNPKKYYKQALINLLRLPNFTGKKGEIMPSVSKENYLKTIFIRNQAEKKPVSTTEIAARLEISNAATSEMAKKLAESGLIKYEKYKGLRLTKKGEKIAIDVVRRHRLWELFLVKVLNLNWAEVHDEAEKLEHISSEKLIDKIDEFLNYPEFDPHGEPIPRKNGKLPVLPETINLSDAEIGESYQIAKVDDSSNELMNYLMKIGVKLNETVKIIEKLNFDNSIIIEIKGSTVNLSEKVTKSIYVIKSLSIGRN